MAKDFDDSQCFAGPHNLRGMEAQSDGRVFGIQHLQPFATREQRPRRTFNPRFSPRYGRPPFDPEVLVRYSPKYTYSRLFNYPYQGSRWRPRMNTIVLQISSLAAPINRLDGGPIQAAGGIYFGTDSHWNSGVFVPMPEPQTHQRAILAALHIALQQLITMRHTILDSRWREAIIMTNNTYVIRSFSKWIWQWEVNGWQHIRRGGLIEHVDLIQNIHNLLTHLETQLNMSVRFWKVGKKDIAQAHGCAVFAQNSIVRQMSIGN